MGVATFIQPDHETQEGTAYKDAIDGATQVMARPAAMFAAHEQDTPNMTVRLDAGALFVSGAVVEKAAQSTGTITAPVTLPRIDRVVIDNATAVVSVVTGVEDASPSPPAIPDGKLPVAQVLLQTTTTVITNDMITDERIGGGAGGADFATDAEAEAGVVTDKAIAPSQLRSAVSPADCMMNEPMTVTARLAASIAHGAARGSLPAVRAFAIGADVAVISSLPRILCGGSRRRARPSSRGT